jgi:hypothetical protein
MVSLGRSLLTISLPSAFILENFPILFGRNESPSSHVSLSEIFFRWSEVKSDNFLPIEISPEY